MAIRKKKRVVRRPKSGLAAVPFNKGFDYCKIFFHQEVDTKDIASSMKTYIKNNYSKQEVQAAYACPEYKFYIMSHYGATAFWNNQGLEHNEKSLKYTDSMKRYISEMIELGKNILAEKKVETKLQDDVVKLSPHQRLQNKISNTIMQDLLDLEDQWIEGEKTSMNIYMQFKKYGLTGSAVQQVRQVIEGWLADYEDAYHKRCEQAVEAYSHLKKPELNHRIKSCQDMLLDLDRIKSAAKATRKTRVKQPKAADKQIAKVQYKKEDTQYKLVSVPPIQLIGKTRLYTFNTKYRTLTEYITESVNGFEISGTTIKNIDPVNSRTVRLRKPDEFLPIVLAKTTKQIDTEWKKLTTKQSVPNGRLNADTILLRVMDK